MPVYIPVSAKGALLCSLLEGRGYGQQLVERISNRTDHHVNLLQGSVYLALGQLMEAKLVREVRGPEANNSKNRYYELTAKGRKEAEEIRSIFAGLAKTHDEVAATAAKEAS